MAEEFKLTSTGEFGFAECPLNPGHKCPGASGFLVGSRAGTQLAARDYLSRLGLRRRVDCVARCLSRG
jgi:hypothetical protein